jgi:glycosyltransferase involved in cell wall biosynthesis
MISDEQLRDELKQKGLARAAKYTWPKAVENTWKVYTELF